MPEIRFDQTSQSLTCHRVRHATLQIQHGQFGFEQFLGLGLDVGDL